MDILKQGAAAMGLALSPAQVESFEIYYRELIAWNRRVNLTTITDRDEVQARHFVDSLTALLAFPEATDNMASCDAKRSVIDVGTGAGFPGIPLRIACPHLGLTLLETTTKRVAFLHHLLKELNLDSVSIIDGRAEDIARLPGYRESFDIAVARAVARLPTLVELCLPLTKVGGRFIALKGANVATEVQEAQNAIAMLGGFLSEVREVDLPELPRGHTLVIVDKVHPTPTQFPRRPGMPTKRPL